MLTSTMAFFKKTREQRQQSVVLRGLLVHMWVYP